MRMLDLFLASENRYEVGGTAAFALETAALRACAPEESMQVEALVARVDELERKLREGVAAATPARKQTAAAPRRYAGRPRRRGRAAPAKEAPKGPRRTRNASGRRPCGRTKQKPQLFGMLKFGRLVSGENGLFTVVYPKAMGAAYVKMLSIPEKNEGGGGLSDAGGGLPVHIPRAAIEGTVQESDKAILSAQEEARKQARKQPEQGIRYVRTGKRARQGRIGKTDKSKFAQIPMGAR